MDSPRAPRRLFCCLALLASTAAAQAPPADVDGWANLRWSMSLADVRALYPDAREAADSSWTRLELPLIRAAGVPLRVTVAARKGESHIALVSLWCAFGLPDSPAASAADFDALKAALLEKYGRSKSAEHRIDYGDPVRLFLWAFPSTTIQLTLTEKRGQPELGMIRIEYRATEPGIL